MRLLLALSVVLALACAATPASAATSRDGLGLFIADDDWDFANPGALPALGDDFARLSPKAFRLQTIWNTVDRPEWMTRTQTMIAHARLRGAQQVILTLRSNNPANVGPEGYFPTAAEYRAKVEPLVAQLASVVDVWGPARRCLRSRWPATTRHSTTSSAAAIRRRWSARPTSSARGRSTRSPST